MRGGGYIRLRGVVEVAPVPPQPLLVLLLRRATPKLPATLLVVVPAKPLRAKQRLAALSIN